MDRLGDSRTLESVHGIDVAISNVAGRTAPAHQLLLLDAQSPAELRGLVASLANMVSQRPGNGLGNLAVNLRGELASRPVRAAIIASSADQASQRLAGLAALLDGDLDTRIDVAGGVFTSRARGEPTIGFLFPGQGSGSGTDGGALTKHFETARDLYRTVTIPEADDPSATRAAQPRIVASSIAGLRVLSVLGVAARGATGHSLGELTALAWAGAMSESALLDLAAARGQIMSDASEPGGAMAGIAADPDATRPLLRDEPVVIAGYNSPDQTVVAGPAAAVTRVRRAAVAAGLKATRIPVSHAFHSPAMAPAADGLAAYLDRVPLRPLEGRVMSTVTGDCLAPGTDLRRLLVNQLCEPVRFSQALQHLASEVDLLVEVGPGRVLTGLAARVCPDTPVVPLTTDATSLSAVLSVAAAAHVLGTPIRVDQLPDGERAPRGDRRL